MSNKAIVSSVAILAISAIVIITGEFLALWALLPVIFLIGNIEN